MNFCDEQIGYLKLLQFQKYNKLSQEQVTKNAKQIVVMEFINCYILQIRQFKIRIQQQVIEKMQNFPEDQQMMMNFIDKLSDHLSNQKIKLFIDSGFDQWEIVSFMKGDQLIQLDFTTQECIIIMVSANSTAKQFQFQDVFSEDRMKTIIEKSKAHWELKKLQLQQHQNNSPNHQQPSYRQQNNIKKTQIKTKTKINLKEYAKKEITQALIWKGTSLKQNKGQQKITAISMVSLQQKGITHISYLQKLPILQILNLSRNHIYKIQNLDNCPRIKTLKLQHNSICVIQGLSSLALLENLTINDNYISRVEGLSNNRNLHYLNLSNQNSNQSLTFDEGSMAAMAYCLQKIQCDNNRVQSIQSFKYLAVVKDISLKGNLLKEIGDLSQPLGEMQMLKILNFKNNPLVKVPKYRDYVVILSKGIQQLDDKKVLASERQYLVKLYSLKHIQSLKDGKGKKSPNSANQLDLQGQKMKESHGGNQFYQATDLRGNQPYQNTKNYNKK